MRSIFRITCVIMLTAIFLTFGLPTVSAEISFDNMIDVDYDFSTLKNIFVIASSTSTIPTAVGTIIGWDCSNLLEKASDSNR